MVSTMTMPVAADSPPMNTSSANHSWRRAMGRVRTKVSASTVPAGKCIKPAKVIGRTKILIASRYSGNSQIALATWFSLTFSTTLIWNWRGRNRIDSIDRKISETQEP
ncbi:hypothetical protein D3C85_546340 [compost metagenome]